MLIAVTLEDSNRKNVVRLLLAQIGKDYSTKGVTRESRANETSRFYQLSEGTPHSSQNAITTVSANKKQLIDLICRNAVSDVTCHVQDASKDKCT